MRNRGHRRREGDEINLTPLLDVLFTILFIVMLTGMQSEKNLQANAEETQEQISEMSGQVSELEGQLTEMEEANSILQSEVNRRDKIEDSSKRYESDAVIVTFINEVADGNHVLRVYTGPDDEVESFRLGLDRAEYTRTHVTQIINDIVEESVDHPVFIVFHCDTKSIYRKEEFNPIKEALETQKKLRKEVFYQIVEE